MKVIIFGATGMAGSEVVRQAIVNPEITDVVAVVRNPLDIEHSKLKTITRTNFLDYTDLMPVFKEVDTCIWCLGISQNLVSKEEYEVITHDYTVKAANAMLAANSAITFIFLSGHGADSKEKSRILFARIKGRTENALKRMNFKELYIARPSSIIPVCPQKNVTLSKKLKVGFNKVLGIIIPSMTITTKQLAQAMLYVAENGYSATVIDNKSLRNLTLNTDF